MPHQLQSSSLSLLIFAIVFFHGTLINCVSSVRQQSFANTPSGACCMNLSYKPKTQCYEYPRDVCEGQGGDYKGDFVRCTTLQPTHPCLGACCTKRGCKEVVQSDCYLLGGVWTRAGSRCDSSTNVCDSSLVGACCYKDNLTDTNNFFSCSVSSFTDCYSGNGHSKGYFWTSGSNCSMAGICPFKLVPYVQPLPIPSTLQPITGKSGCQGVLDGDYTLVLTPPVQKVARAEYRMNATQIQHKYYPFFPNPQVAFGYAGSYPGPTIEACRGVPILVRYYNQLPNLPHPLGFDTCAHGPNFLPNVPYTSVHLHGAKNAPRFDGWPDSLVFPGDSYTYLYENVQNSSSLLYHDHGIGITRKNVMIGLMGLYFLRSVEDPKLPQGDYEIPLLIQDRSFTYNNGKVDLYYQATYSVSLPFPGDDFSGTVIVMNGVVNPYLEVTPSQYRLRLYNGANTRTFTLNFVQVTDDGSIEDVPFLIIGSDQGFLVTPQSVSSVSLSPAERADIIIDFSSFEAGSKLWLVNSAPFPFPNGNPRGSLSYVAVSTQWTPVEVMEFRVLGVPAPKISIPLHLLKNYSQLPVSAARTVRSFLTSIGDPTPVSDECLVKQWVLRRFKTDGNPSNGFLSPSEWDALEYITQDFLPVLDTIEIWEFWNPLTEVHPIHVHGSPFQILSINAIVWDGVNMETMAISYPINFDPIQLAWKDVVKVMPYTVVRIITLFNPYQGKYPIHCHILEHEDNDMMRQFRVVDPLAPCELRSGSACGNKMCEAANGENCLNCPLDCISGPGFCCGYELPSLQTEYLQSAIVLPLVQNIPAMNTNTTTTNFIGCGPPRKLSLGQTRQCQRLEEDSQYYLAVSCRIDYVDSCCGDNWCEALKNEVASCPEDCSFNKLRI